MQWLQQSVVLRIETLNPRAKMHKSRIKPTICNQKHTILFLSCLFSNNSEIVFLSRVLFFAVSVLKTCSREISDRSIKRRGGRTSRYRVAHWLPNDSEALIHPVLGLSFESFSAQNASK